METQKLFIEGPLPGLNRIIAASKQESPKPGHRGRRWSGYNQIKRHWGEVIELLCRAYSIKPVGCAYFDFTWYERNRRRDPDNIAAGGRKVIFDAFIKAGVIENDGWKQVAGITDRFVRVDEGRAGVLVVIREHGRG